MNHLMGTRFERDMVGWRVERQGDETAKESEERDLRANDSETAKSGRKDCAGSARTSKNST
jgi:hypothetical protein